MADDGSEKITALFGEDDTDDSDDSDLDTTIKGKGDNPGLDNLSESSESEDDEAPRKRLVRKKVAAPRSKKRKQETKGKAKKLKLKVKRSKTADGDAEEKDDFIASDDDEDKEIVADYNAQKEYADDEDPYGDDDSNGNPEEEVDEFQQAVDRLSKRGRNNKKKMSEDEKIRYCDEIVEKMAKAADEDQMAAAEDRPALAKFKMLDEVVKNLSDTNLQTTFVEQTEMLAAIRMWLQPLKATKTLPNVMVRSALIDILGTLAVDKQLLLQKSDSAITKVIHFLKDHPKETPENKKKLQAIFHRWCRMVYDKTSNYRLLEEMQRSKNRSPATATPPRSKEKLRRNVPVIGKQGLSSLAQKVEKTDKGTNLRARVPQPMVFDFKFRPQENSTLAGSSSSDPQGKPKTDNYAKKLERKIKTLRKPVQKNKRAVKMSIEGRG